MSLAGYPSESSVKDLAHAIYNCPDILTNSPEWVLRYRKGRQKLVNNTVMLPNCQVTVSSMDPKEYKTEDDVVTAIE